MKLIVGIIILAAVGISAGWWNMTQVTNVSTQVVKAGTDVTGIVANALTSAKPSATPKPSPTK